MWGCYFGRVTLPCKSTVWNYTTLVHTSSCKLNNIHCFPYSASKALAWLWLHNLQYFIYLVYHASVYFPLMVLDWHANLTLRSIQRYNITLFFLNLDKDKTKSHWFVLRPAYKNYPKVFLQQPFWSWLCTLQGTFTNICNTHQKSSDEFIYLKIQ